MLRSRSPVPTVSPPLLDLRAPVLRGPAGDEVALPELALGERCLVLLGDFSALFAWLGGAGERVAGAAHIRGEDGRAALLAGRVGLAPRELPWEPRQGVFDALALSVALSGVPHAEARRAARATVDALGLLALCPRRTSTLSPLERAAVSLAHAALPVRQAAGTLAPPPVLALEAPLVPGDDRDVLLGLIDRLAERAALIVGVPAGRSDEPTLARLLARADALAERAFGALIHAGAPPSEARPAVDRYRVEALGRWTAFAAALAERGVEAALIEAPAPDGSAAALLSVPAGRGTRDIVAAAVASGAALGQLAPLASAPLASAPPAAPAPAQAPDRAPGPS